MKSFTSGLAAERMRRRAERVRQLEAERDAREAALIRRLPRLGEIQEELARVGLALGRAALRRKGPHEPGPAELLARARALTEERQALLYRHGVDPRELEVWWDCPDCQDTGWIREPVEPGQESIRPPRKCHCLQREEIEDLYRISGLTGPLREHVFEGFDPTVYPAGDRDYMTWVCDECRRHADAVAGGGTCPNLLLEGAVGLGKTFLVTAMANRVLQAGRLAVYFTFPEFVEILRRMRLEEPGAQTEAAPVFEADLLILDDLGAEKVSEFVGQELFNVLNRRIGARRPLVITTNLDLRELGEYYGARIASRIVGHFEAIRLRGEDVRLVLKRRAARRSDLEPGTGRGVAPGPEAWWS